MSADSIPVLVPNKPLFGPLTKAKRKRPRSRYRTKARRRRSPDGNVTRCEAKKIRMTPFEFEAIAEGAKWAGLSMSVYMVVCSLNDWQRRRDARKAP